MALPAVFVRTSDQNYVVVVELKPAQDAYRKADGPSLEAYLTRGPKNPTPPQNTASSYIPKQTATFVFLQYIRVLN